MEVTVFCRTLLHRSFLSAQREHARACRGRDPEAIFVYGVMSQDQDVRMCISGAARTLSIIIRALRGLSEYRSDTAPAECQPTTLRLMSLGRMT